MGLFNSIIGWVGIAGGAFLLYIAAFADKINGPLWVIIFVLIAAGIFAWET